MTVLVAIRDAVFRLEKKGRLLRPTSGLEARPTCLAADRTTGVAWSGTTEGVYRSEDGRSWEPAGLAGEEITALSASPATSGLTWAGTEPSAVYRTADGGSSWERARGLEELPSSSEWAFPPRPETHHVRWIACHPEDPGRLWVAIEAGALITTSDGGSSWRDRVPGSPYDTHEVAIHPDCPETLRIAAGDGFFESDDGGESWRTPQEGLAVGYLRSVAVDPGEPNTVVVSAASAAKRAYAAGRADGRLYRREGSGPWRRVTAGWPDEPDTIAPLLAAGTTPGVLWAGDERGVHRSADGGRSWQQAALFEETPAWLRGLAVLAGG